MRAKEATRCVRTQVKMLGAKREPDNLGSEAATQSNTYRHNECPKNVRIGHIDRKNTPDSNRALEGHRGEQGGGFRDTKVNPDHQNVVDDAEYNRICLGSEENKLVVEMKGQC